MKVIILFFLLTCEIITRNSLMSTTFRDLIALEPARVRRTLKDVVYGSVGPTAHLPRCYERKKEASIMILDNSPLHQAGNLERVQLLDPAVVITILGKNDSLPRKQSWL